MKSAFTVRAIGTGLDPRRHLTMEATDALRRVRKAFYFGELAGIEQVLERHVEIENLVRFARYGEPRRVTYEHVVDYIVRSLPEFEDVAWLTAGSPYVIDGATTLLRERAAEGVFELRIVDGISSIGSVMGALQLDIAGAGLQIVDANALILRRLAVDPQMPLLLMQFARAGTRLQTLSYRMKPEGLTEISGVLSRLYRPDHPCCLVTAASVMTPADQQWSKIGTLFEAVTKLTPWTSLFVPPIAASEISTASTMMLDAKELERRFETPLERALGGAARPA